MSSTGFTHPAGSASSAGLPSPWMITNPLRPALLAAARSARAERSITRMPVTRRIVDRFVAGEDRGAALATVRDLVRRNRFVTIDYLGEDTRDPGQAERVAGEYLRLIDELALVPVEAGDRGGGAGVCKDTAGPRPLEVSVKLSALGQALPDDGHAVALRNARAIAESAAAAGIWVTVDAEDHTTTESTHEIVRELRREHPETVGTVLQAYLRRTEADCRAFAAEGARIRL